jgi:hypothetical protein
MNCESGPPEAEDGDGYLPDVRNEPIALSVFAYCGVLAMLVLLMALSGTFDCSGRGYGLRDVVPTLGQDDTPAAGLSAPIDAGTELAPMSPHDLEAMRHTDVSGRQYRNLDHTGRNVGDE